jgi:hypothetical protein
LFSKAKLGACLACLLLLPLPLVAYTIAPWSFTPGKNFSLTDSSTDHKTLTYNGSSGQGNDRATATSTVTASAGETLSAHLSLPGLTFQNNGSLTVTITVGSTTRTHTLNADNPVFDFPGIALAAGSQNITVSFQFNNASWDYTASTPSNLVFR